MDTQIGAYHPHDRVQVFFPEKSRTKQSFADETNINEIMRKYEKTGLIAHLNTHQGEYGDFLGFEDYHTSLNRIHAAREAFMSIPAGIRSRFNNDPATFMSFAQNPDNLDELRKMGLAHPVEPEAPPVVPPTEDTPVPTVKPGEAPEPPLPLAEPLS